MRGGRADTHADRTSETGGTALGAAEDLFEQFVAGGLDLIHRMGPEAWQEDLLLDFKTAEGGSAPMTKADRRNLGEALSGFANSDGGVIVWGVDARAAGRDEPDVAQDVAPVEKLGLLVSDLHRLTPQVVSPGVLGVQHHPIAEPSNADSGYVVTLVPRSESDLHMAVAADQHRFYYRSGSSFLPMESYMVADRLGRRPQPRLELDCRLERGSSDAHSQKVKIVIGIRNVGRGVALYPAIALQRAEGWALDEYGLDGNRRTGLPRRPRSADPTGVSVPLFAGGADTAIYPGTVLEVTCLSANIPRSQDDYPDLVIRHELYCDGFSSAGEATVAVMDFVSSLRESGGT
jgi:hypothetical protein